MSDTPPKKEEINANDTELWFVVYGVEYRGPLVPNPVFCYIGHTGRGHAREREHFNLASGARRLVTAFAQEWNQPREDHFELKELWSGYVTKDQAKAIEQHFMDTRNTRVFPRPTNGVTVDIDLFDPTNAPLQLNVNHACRDVDLIDWAAVRVKRDSAIVSVRSEREQAEVTYALTDAALVFSESAAACSLAIAMRAVGKYQVRDGDEMVSIREVHTDLNDVLAALHEDDGVDTRKHLLALVAVYNTDKRGEDAKCRVAMANSLFESVVVSLGGNVTKPKESPALVLETSAPTGLLYGNWPTTTDGIKKHIVDNVVQSLEFGVRGSIVTLEDIGKVVAACCHPCILDLVEYREPFIGCKFQQYMKKQLEESHGLKFTSVKGSASLKASSTPRHKKLHLKNTALRAAPRQPSTCGGPLNTHDFDTPDAALECCVEKVASLFEPNVYGKWVTPKDVLDRCATICPPVLWRFIDGPLNEDSLPVIPNEKCVLFTKIRESFAEKIGVAWVKIPSGKRYGRDVNDGKP
eukprot:7142605-Prymnesium_polylepis.1